MDPRKPRLRRKLAAIPFQPLRSHSFGEEQHKFFLGPKPAEARVAAFEAEHDLVLPDAYRHFLTHIGGSGAAPFYGLLPLERCSPLVMNPRGGTGDTPGFDGTAPRAHGRDLFLHIIEMGCTDVCIIAVTGPLTGRVLIGNGDGFWAPTSPPPPTSSTGTNAGSTTWAPDATTGPWNSPHQSFTPAAPHQAKATEPRARKGAAGAPPYLPRLPEPARSRPGGDRRNPMTAENPAASK